MSIKRREKGTGSIVRTTNGKFKGTITLSSGKRVSKTYETRKEVEEFFNKVRHTDVKYYTPTTVEEYWEHFIELKSAVYRESTLNGMRHFYRKHVVGSKIAKTKFYDLTPQDINRYFLGLASHGYSTSTLTRWRKNFKAILETAVYEGYLESNPMVSKAFMRNIKGKAQRHIQTFSKEEVSKLLDEKNLSTLPLVYQVYIVLGMVTGARPQEILALTKEDVTANCVYFCKSLGFRGKLQEDNMMKTLGSERRVPLSSKWGKWLVDHIEELPMDKLFYSMRSTYGYMNVDNVNMRFRKYTHAVLGGRGRYHLYSMRHTFATLLITEEHVDVMTVSRLMGHSNIETTLKYYTHSSAENTGVTWSYP